MNKTEDAKIQDQKENKTIGMDEQETLIQDGEPKPRKDKKDIRYKSYTLRRRLGFR